MKQIYKKILGATIVMSVLASVAVAETNLICTAKVNGGEKYIDTGAENRQDWDVNGVMVTVGISNDGNAAIALNKDGQRIVAQATIRRYKGFDDPFIVRGELPIFGKYNIRCVMVTSNSSYNPGAPVDDGSQLQSKSYTCAIETPNGFFSAIATGKDNAKAAVFEKCQNALGSKAGICVWYGASCRLTQ